MKLKTYLLGGSVLLAAAGGFSIPAMAQAAPDGEGKSAEVLNEGDIIVTARRREETAQETPVALTVLNEALLDRYAVKGIATIASLTPGMLTGESSGAMGGSISLRGVGSGESMAFIDQAVSINVDGVAISSAQIMRASQMDLKQIEVLRGPQALFFGKNSPGGIISLTTADPGDETEVMLRAGYEFEANERYVEATFSQPVSDTVGVRMAGRYSKMDGYIKVVSPVVAGQIPSDLSSFPETDEMFLRTTLTWKPTDRMNVRLKATYTDTDIKGGSSFFSDITACPYGVPQRPSEDASNCKNDGVIFTSKLSPATMALSPYLENPNGNRNNSQVLLTGNIDYELADQLTLTSVTGYYHVKEHMTSNGGYGPVSNNAFFVGFKNDQVSEELRLASDYDGAFNFLIGGFYESRKLYTLTSIVVPQFALTLPTESTHQKQTSYSVFGQLMYDVAENVELTAGGRYTHEVKDLRDFTVTTAAGVTTDVTTMATYPDTKQTFNNFSPEVTLTYKPTADLMVYGSFKMGYKSGGFDAGYTNGAILTAARQAQGQTFDPEKVIGGEIGLKSSLADRQVMLNLTGYWYDYKDLQVSVFDTIARAFRLENAAKARVRGIEFETHYRPNGVPGLDLHATAAYNDAKFRDYVGDCYAGQTVQLGCNLNFNPAANQAAAPAFGASYVNGKHGLYTAQDLSGHRMRKAPEFSATVGGYYEFPVSTGLMMSLSSDLSYSGDYDVGTQLQPIASQSSFAKIDATLRLFSEDKRWELAAIGRNLTDKRNLVNGIDRTGTGGSKGADAPSCATISSTSCIKTADLIGTPATPFMFALQFTYRY